jgi:hypothetical protein
MSWPAIIYNPGTGPVTLQFQRPARFQCAFNYQAVRHDNIASSGVKEPIFERLDTFFDFEMEWVGIGADVNAWNSFMVYALQGGQFQYFPDASQSAYTNYWLEDTNWTAAYKCPGQYTFKMKFRQVVAS